MDRGNAAEAMACHQAAPPPAFAPKTAARPVSGCPAGRLRQGKKAESEPLRASDIPGDGQWKAPGLLTSFPLFMMKTRGSTSMVRTLKRWNVSLQANMDASRMSLP